MRLDGKNALVTGGTRGIGAAVAARLLAAGASVTVTGTESGGLAPTGCGYLAIDFADTIATERFADELASGMTDILINNAGINKISSFERIDPRDFDRIHLVNLRAPLLLCRAVLPGMRRRGWGRIVNITSIFGVVSKELRGPYSASKFGLDGMTAALAVEVAAEGVLANCVAPGFVDTDLTRRILGESGISDLLARIPIRRLALVEEIADFIVWLAGPENTYITAQNIPIDGGFTRV